jgi:Beta-lactamase class C and other penicillin binding proteins
LSEDINQYLTSWKFPYDTIAGNKKISIINLLTHAAGLNVHGFSGYAVGDSLPNLPEILDGKHPANNGAFRSQSKQGTKVDYSGGGIVISQLIIENISHQPYETYMWNNVLKPLGMLNSSFSQPPSS